MESLRVHGVTVEVPNGLSDDARQAFFVPFVRETPEDLTPEEAQLHVELFLAQHTAQTTPAAGPASTPAASEAATVAGVDPAPDLED